MTPPTNLFSPGPGRRTDHRRLVRPILRALLALLVLLATLARAPQGARAQDDLEPEQREDPAVEELVQRYLRDPVGTRRELLRFPRDGATQLPPQMLVLLGDAQLRSGNYRAAERLFAEAGATTMGQPWDGLAALGSGLSRVGRGDLEGAVPFLERAMEMPGDAGDYAALAAGQVAAAEGRYDDAYAAFDRVLANEEIRPELGEAAAFARAATAYAAGDDERAAAGFESLAQSDPNAPIATDARYGAALALLAQGRRDEATALLEALTRDCEAQGRRGVGAAALRELAPRAVLRRWLRNYREVGFDLQPSGEEAAPLASLDGCRLARIKLRELTGDEPAPAAVRAAEPAAAHVQAAAREEGKPAPAPPPEAAAPPAESAEEGRTWPWLVGALLVGVLLAVWRTRRSPRRAYRAQRTATSRPRFAARGDFPRAACVEARGRSGGGIVVREQRERRRGLALGRGLARPACRGTMGGIVRVQAFVLAIALVAPLARAAASGPVAAPHVSVELVPEVTHVRPGEAFGVGLRFDLEPGWHVYWSNPGDSGLAPSLRWELPEGVTAGPLEWPYPERIAVGPLVNYGYEGEVLLPVALTAADTLRAGETVRLAARADWLVCKEDCIPGRADLTLDLPVSEAPARSDERWAQAFAEARARLPRSDAAARIEAMRRGQSIELEIHGAPPGEIRFFPAEPEHIENAAPQTLSREGEVATLALETARTRRTPVERLRGTLVADAGFAPHGAQAIALDVAVGAAPAPRVDEAPAAAVPGGDALPLWLAVAFAALGGLLLNVMPCVFPVLSIKILDFVRQAGGSASRLRVHGIVYAVGVLVSFWVLAGVLVALRAGGEGLGWGFQLQSPAFVVAMIFLLYVLAASLLGVFEIGLRLTALAGRVPQGEGLGGSFATGVLATAIATPCTAPFMGPALGYALTLPWAGALLVFTVLGAGMALPYVLLCFAPGLLRLLPRSGPWLETFKQAMAFPLLATVVWLVWVLGQQAGVDAILGTLAGLLLVTFALWLRARFATGSRSRAVRRFAVATSVVLSVAGLATALALRGADAGDAAATEHRDLYGNAWRPYSAAALAELRAAGSPVFVDFTAAWCLTCKVNEHVVFSSEEVREAFAERGVALLRADWTSRDDEITRALASFGRSGVPLYVLYGAGEEPRILPSILTRGIVLEALAELDAHRG